MVLKEGLEVLEAVLAEEEGIDSWAKLLEGEVGGRKECSTGVVGGVELLEKAGLAESELEGAEFGGEQIDDLQDARWW